MKPAAIADLFRTNLRIVREQRGISQSELGRRIGKTPGYICDLERGRRTPNLTTLGDIADGLGVLPGDLVSAKIPKTKPIQKKR